jgi:hypothetical protein
MAAKKKVRPTYRVHTEDSYNAAIRDTVRPGTIFWDWLTEARLETCTDSDPIKRAEFEGARKFAQMIQEIVLNDDHGTEQV